VKSIASDCLALILLRIQAGLLATVAVAPFSRLALFIALATVPGYEMSRGKNKAKTSKTKDGQNDDAASQSEKKVVME